MVECSISISFWTTEWHQAHRWTVNQDKWLVTWLWCTKELAHVVKPRRKGLVECLSLVTWAVAYHQVAILWMGCHRICGRLNWLLLIWYTLGLGESIIRLLVEGRVCTATVSFILQHWCYKLKIIENCRSLSTDSFPLSLKNDWRILFTAVRLGLRYWTPGPSL